MPGLTSAVANAEIVGSPGRIVPVVKASAWDPALLSS
jgi:hypothetical protein